MDGSFAGSRAWHKNPESKVSAHYFISKKGEILQMVKDSEKAWAAMDANPFSLNIEHEDASFVEYSKGKFRKVKNCTNDPKWITEAMWKASVQLTVALCKKYSIPVENIIGHDDPWLRKYRNRRSDPGPFWNLNKYRQDVKAILDNG